MIRGEIMNDEIKEILDYWKFYINEPNNYKLLNVHFDEIKKVLDYITNLQQAVEVKNERIKEEQQEKERYIKFYNELNIWNKELQQENERLKELNKNASKVCMAEHRYGVDKAEEARDYKSRCEKAIEYIKKSIDNSQPFYEYLFGDENGKVENLDILLNILQNGGENDE